MREVVIKVLKDYLRKNKEVDYEKIADQIIENELAEKYHINDRRIRRVSRLYHLVDKDESVKYTAYVSKVIANEFGINKNQFTEHLLVDNNVTKFMIEYLNMVHNKKISFSVIKKNANNILAILEQNNIEYQLIIEAQKKTFEKLGQERGVTKESIRQRINHLKEILKDRHLELGYDFLIASDLRLIPEYEQAIVYANKDKIYNRNFDLYFFTEDNQKVLTIIEQALLELESQGSKLINTLYQSYQEILNYYVNRKNNFYVSAGEIYSIKRQNKKEVTNYFINFLEEFEIRGFQLDEKIVRQFAKTRHGVLYEKKTNAELTPFNLSVNLDREMELYKIGTDKYLYDPNFKKTLEVLKEKFRNKIKRNLPLKGQKQLNDIFGQDFQDFNLSKQSIYFILKRLFENEFYFKKNNIYPADEVGLNNTEEMFRQLEERGYYIVRDNTNITHMIKRAKLHFKSEHIIYLREKIVLVEEKYFIDYDTINKLEFSTKFDDIIMRQEFIRSLPQELREKYTSSLLMKIYAEIKGYSFTKFYLSKNPKINSVEELFAYYFKDVKDNISVSEMREFSEYIGKNYYMIINLAEEEELIVKSGDVFKKIF